MRRIGLIGCLAFSATSLGVQVALQQGRALFYGAVAAWLGSIVLALATWKPAVAIVRSVANFLSILVAALAVAYGLAAIHLVRPSKGLDPTQAYANAAFLIGPAVWIVAAVLYAWASRIEDRSTASGHGNHPRGQGTTVRGSR
ncbi:MAG TPA: hypothetical protein VHE55_09110 [Fimbriimonadaceae bacterium]|nr:hypothetical protein [Fimbriimonadaceae bacterium]